MFSPLEVQASRISCSDHTPTESLLEAEQVSPVQKKGGKTLGPEWDVFDRDVRVKTDPKGNCKYCSTVIRGKLTSMLVAHILECTKAPAECKARYRELQRL